MILSYFYKCDFASVFGKIEQNPIYKEAKE